MIGAAAGRLVLLLGRFTGPHREMLDRVSYSTLADRQYIPMVFDFSPPDGRDVIESVAILAGLSHFVIADLTDPRSTPLESQLLVPMLAIPFFPIVHRGSARVQHVLRLAAQATHGCSRPKPIGEGPISHSCSTTG